MPTKPKTIFIFFLLFDLASTLHSAVIQEVELGRHSGYSLLVITCDKEVPYTISESQLSVAVAFPVNTSLMIPAGDFALIKDDFIRSLDYNPASGKLKIETSFPFKLRTYVNRRPFQLVMDFTHKPQEAVKTAPPVDKKPAPTKESPPPEVKKTEPAKKETPPPPPPVKTEPEPASADSLPADFFEKGLALQKIGDYAAALDAFQKSVPVRKDQALYRIALLYEEMGQREKAIEQLLAIVQTSPGWLEPRLKLAILYKLSGRDDTAETIWMQVLEVVEPDSLYNFAPFSIQIDSLEKAFADIDIDDSPGIFDGMKLPDLPYVPIAIVILLAFSVIAVRLIVNWRMNRLLKSVDNLPVEDAAPPVDLASTVSAPQPLASNSILDKEISLDGWDELDSKSSSGSMTDEKQQMIYELLDKNYSIAEIAKMLDMGQEEIKFIIDFRAKT